MKICQEHDRKGLEIGVVYSAHGVHEGDCPVCDDLKEKDLEIDQLKQEIDVLEERIGSMEDAMGEQTP